MVGFFSVGSSKRLCALVVQHECALRIRSYVKVGGVLGLNFCIQAYKTYLSLTKLSLLSIEKLGRVAACVVGSGRVAVCARHEKCVLRVDMDGWLPWSLDRVVTETALYPSLRLSWASQCRNTLKHFTMKTLFDRRLRCNTAGNVHSLPLRRRRDEPGGASMRLPLMLIARCRSASEHRYFGTSCNTTEGLRFH